MVLTKNCVFLDFVLCSDGADEELVYSLILYCVVMVLTKNCVFLDFVLCSDGADEELCIP